MKGRFLIVDKQILPDYYEKVVQARTMLRDGLVREVSEAVRRVGISRSTYYKYKDFIFEPSEDTPGRNAILSFMLSHQKGVLGEVLSTLSAMEANVLTITQNLPVAGHASVIIAVDTSAVPISIDQMLENMQQIKGVESTELIAIE